MEENKENVVEETTNKEQPKAEEKVEKIKIKKPKISTVEPEVYKVDLSKKEEEPVVEQPVVEEVVTEPLKTEEVLEEIKVEEPKIQLPPQPELPENIQKLVSFMKDTGGDVQDYVRLNQNYDEWDNDDLVRAYYRDQKPHLNEDEITFLMDEEFKYDEGFDDEKAIKRKKLALKEQVAQAKQHLESVKSKYYDDLKMGANLTEEQSEALRFYKESQNMQKVQQEAQQEFINKTNEVFTNDFQGFDYKVGDKVYRYKINDVEGTKNTQVDINNFVKKFLNKNNQMENAAGYHKGLFTAMNSDAIANHFYEQGKADALKESISKSKNVDMAPRQQHGVIEAGGMKIRVLNPDDNSGVAKFKFKKRK
tara:strand:- start:1059 stop:2150 length:1092 start_codon:yes stop_codon:yes gene_type:complete